jgi:arylsulfatase A-like enzyme
VTLLRTALKESEITIADHLKDFGFNTGAIGKMHFNSALTHGFDYRIDTPDHRRYLEDHPPQAVEGVRVRPPWRPFKDPARIWLNSEILPGGLHQNDSEATFFVRYAIEFLRNYRDRRFCLWLSFREPHSPFNFPVEWAGTYKPENMKLPRVGTDDNRWIPSVFRNLTEEEKKGIVAAYYSSVAYLDSRIGLVLDELEKLELDQNTLVIYVGDHGYLLGHHGRFEKHTMWEPAVRSPLIVRGPDIKPSISFSLVEFIDLVPTILDCLGVPPLKSAQGQSLLPLLRGEKESLRKSVFSEFLPDNKAMIRTDRFKYIFWAGKEDLAMGYATGFPPPGITQRVYDLSNDPDEFQNLAEDPQYFAALEHLQHLLLERFQNTHPFADRLPHGLSIEEQLAWFTEPPEIRQ